MFKKPKLRRRIKKDYLRKNFKNPFFRSYQEVRGWRFFRWIFLAGLALLIFLSWFFLMSPWWRLKNIEITGLTRRQNVDIEKVVWQQTAEKRGWFFHQSNILLFDVDQVNHSLIDQYSFSSLNIKKRFPKTLKIDISERPYAFIFQERERLAYADASGFLITETNVADEDKTKYFILENQSPNSLLNEKNMIVIKKAYLDFAFNLYQYLITFSDLPIEKFIIDQELNTLKVKFISGPTAFFNISDEVNSQVDRLVLVKKDKIRDNFSRTNYIDLRYGSRVYINPEF